MSTPSLQEATTQATELSGIAALGINAPTLITQVVNVVILFLILRWLLYRPVTELLEKRRLAIEEGLARAEQARKDADAAGEQAATVLSTARLEARQLLDQARVGAERIASDITAKAEEQSQRIVEQARTQLGQEKAAMRADLEQELGGLVVAATERVLTGKQISISADDVKTALSHEMRQHGA
jgi:F-type H+-transporting ATPase subunit b